MITAQVTLEPTPVEDGTPAMAQAARSLPEPARSLLAAIDRSIAARTELDALTSAAVAYYVAASNRSPLRMERCEAALRALMGDGEAVDAVIDSLRRGRPADAGAALDPKTVVLLRHARKLVKGLDALKPADFDELRAAGVGDAELIALVCLVVQHDAVDGLIKGLGVAEAVEPA